MSRSTPAAAAIVRRCGVTVVAGAALAGAAPAAWSIGPDAARRPQPPAVVADTGYVDGSYSATGWYGGLPSSITVNVTLVAGTVRSVRVTPHATDPTSLDLQRRFAAAVPAVVVGKRLDDVNVGRLAGSSGTPRGFNDAIRRIREQARGGGSSAPDTPRGVPPARRPE